MIRLRFACLIAALVAVSIAAAYPVVSRPQLTDSSQLAASVLKRVSELRRLPVRRPVRSGLKTRDEIERIVIRDLEESTTPEEFDAADKALLKFGLVPRGFDIRATVIGLLKEQVAGFYQPKTQHFYLAAWVPPADQKMVIAHELAHALQDQHFDLRRFENWPKGDADAELAGRALVEGEAMIVMMLYIADEAGMRLDVGRLPSLAGLVEGAQDSKDYPMLAAAPAVIRETLQFPYLYGATFVQSILRNRTWAAVDAAHKKLPASTEQIMHPERYLISDDPVRVSLSDLSPITGSEWKQLTTDVTGEFGYLLVLSEFIDKTTARRAADGWGGDRFALYEKSGDGALLLVQFTTWDSEADAREFFSSYVDRTRARYGTREESPATERALFNTDEGYVLMERRELDVVIIEGAPDVELAGRLLDRAARSGKRR